MHFNSIASNSVKTIVNVPAANKSSQEKNPITEIFNTTTNSSEKRGMKRIRNEEEVDNESHRPNKLIKMDKNNLSSLELMIHSFPENFRKNLRLGIITEEFRKEFKEKVDSLIKVLNNANIPITYKSSVSNQEIWDFLIRYQIKNLDFSNNHEFEDIRTLEKFYWLESLNISNISTNLNSNRTFKYLFEFFKKINLKKLIIQKSVIKESWSNLFQGLGSIEYLDLGYHKSPKDTPKYFNDLLNGLLKSNLKELHLQNWRFDENQIIRFVNLVPLTKLTCCSINIENLELKKRLEMALCGNKLKINPNQEISVAEKNNLLDTTEKKAMDIDSSDDVRLSLAKTYDLLHFFVFDFNLDAIPAILKSLKEKHWEHNNAFNIGTTPLQITIIKPTKAPPIETTAIGDSGIDEGLKELANMQCELKMINESEIEKEFHENNRELRIYIGETVNCGATSSVRKGKDGNLGDGSDELTGYHLEQHLQKVRKFIHPDIIISENHTFPYEVKKRIFNLLNEDKKNGYYIHYEKVHHAPYTLEYRSRIYLVATRTLIRPGVPQEISFGFSEEVKPLSEISKEILQTGVLSDERPDPSQEKLLKDVLANFAAVYQLAGEYPDQYKIEVLFNKISLKIGEKYYWLKIKKDRNYKISCDSFAFINPDTNDIRLVKIEEGTEASWIQSRFFHHANPRVTRTITSLDQFGTNIWGGEDKLKKLATYKVARVHGCSKKFAELIQNNYKDKIANGYIGHVYSTNVLSRLLTYTIWKVAQTNLDYLIQGYPSNFPYMNAIPVDVREDILSFKKNGCFNLQDNGDLVFSDQDQNLLTPSMSWVEVSQEEIQKFANDDQFVPPMIDRSSKDAKKLIENILGYASDHTIGEILTNAGQIIYSHQIEGVIWLLNQRLLGRKGGILADDMGLGKTVQAITYLKMINQCSEGLSQFRPHLIIIPLRLQKTWANYLKLFFEEASIQFLQYRSDFSTEDFRSKRIIIATEEFIKRHTDLIEEVSFDTIIIDEAQDMRNPDTDFSKGAKLVNAEYRLTLSGTPLENKIADIVNLLLLINPELPLTLKEDYTEVEIEVIREYLQIYMLRRLKKNIDLKLGEKIYKNKDIIPDPLQLKMIDQIKNTSHKLDVDIGHDENQNVVNETKQSGNPLAKLTFNLQICDHPSILHPTAFAKLQLESRDIEKIATSNFPKIEKFLKVIRKRYPEGYDETKHNSFVVFSRFNEVLKVIEQKIRESNIFKFSLPVLALSADKDFQNIINDFSEGRYPGLLLNLQQGKGLNLQQADCVFLFEPWWNPQTEKQAEDRVYRIGQKNDVTIYRFRLKDTLELEKIKPIQKKKFDTFNDLIDTISVSEESNDPILVDQSDTMELEDELKINDNPFLDEYKSEISNPSEEPCKRFFEAIDFNNIEAEIDKYDSYFLPKSSKV